MSFLFNREYTGLKLVYPNVEWTKDMLVSKYEQVMFAQNDPAGLTNARLALINYSTPARVVSNLDGTSNPVNGEELCEYKDAKEVFDYLKTTLGLPPEITLHEYSFGNPTFTVDWKGETRRFWRIGNGNVEHSVVAILEMFAKMPSNVALQVVKEFFVNSGILQVP